jgi:hypothetical protein
LKKVSDGIGSMTNGKASGEQAAMQRILAQHQRQTSAERAANTATTVLNPFDGQPPGYNYLGPMPPAPKGPVLPPSPNNGSGSGGVALEYQPEQPGNNTRDIAVDVTELQNGTAKRAPDTLSVGGAVETTSRLRASANERRGNHNCR